MSQTARGTTEENRILKRCRKNYPDPVTVQTVIGHYLKEWSMTKKKIPISPLLHNNMFIIDFKEKNKSFNSHFSFIFIGTEQHYFTSKIHAFKQLLTSLTPVSCWCIFNTIQVIFNACLRERVFPSDMQSKSIDWFLYDGNFGV